VDPRYERGTISVEDRHWWYRGRRRIVSDAIEALDRPAGARILDAGCGSGRNMVELARFGEVVGVDPAEYSVARARERGVGSVVQAGLEQLPMGDDEFDVVACLDVIEHLDDDVGALRELSRVTKPGGHLLVTVPAYPSLWSHHDEVNRHRRRYTRRTLREAMLTGGWQPQRLTGFNTALLPAVAAYRAVERFRKTPPDHEASDLEATPGWANGILERVLLGEAALLRRGAGLPAGLSLMVVARNP
jgi:ubiquinone/menaquinone biosynthesis C-methylase UbiE